jgi:hypothetical protein
VSKEDWIGKIDVSLKVKIYFTSFYVDKVEVKAEG